MASEQPSEQPMDVDGEASSHPIARTPSHGDKPRGILKRQESSTAPAQTAPAENRPTGVSWNEANLYNNEAQRDSTMKITEPKTPYVQWNPETDEVMNLERIPGFELGLADSVKSPTDAVSGEQSSGASQSGPSEGSQSRHSSFSGSRHSSFSGSRRGSDVNGEKKVDIVLEDDTPEDWENMSEEAREKHRQFKNMRKNHYGNEADAMKRAQELIAQESALVDSDDEAPPLPNGH